MWWAPPGVPPPSYTCSTGGRSGAYRIHPWQVCSLVVTIHRLILHFVLNQKPSWSRKVLRVPAYPYAAILLHDRIILNWHVILHCTIPKPYIHWKGMLLSRHHCSSCAAACNLRHLAASYTLRQCHVKTITFQCIYGFGMLWQRITGLFKQFWPEGKIAC